MHHTKRIKYSDKGVFYATLHTTKEGELYMSFAFFKLLTSSEYLTDLDEWQKSSIVTRVFRNKVLIQYNPSMYSERVLKLMHTTANELIKKHQKSKAA